MDALTRNSDTAGKNLAWMAAIVFALGWFTYDTPARGLACILVYLAVSFVALIGFVPAAGPFLYWKLAGSSLLPALLQSAGLEPTWLTTLLLILGLIISIVYTVVAVLVILGMMIAFREAQAARQSYDYRAPGAYSDLFRGLNGR